MTTDKQRPTRGQQRILQECCRVSYVLRAVRDSPLEARYELIERHTERVIQPITARMVSSLQRAGWIEPVRGSGGRDITGGWTYRVTEAGIAAANQPRE